MAVKKILTLPDETLKQRSRPITEVGPAEQQLFEDLRDTTRESPGFALAAPQIGVLKRAICVDASQAKRPTPDNNGEVILFNPQIVSGQNPEVNREGCLSVPKYTGDVERYQKIIVKGIDINGESIELTSHEWEAVAFQHEIDHLDGIVFIDRISSLEDGLFKRKPRG